MAENNAAPKQAIQLVGSPSELSASLAKPAFRDMVKAVAGKYMSDERIVKVALLARTRTPGLAKCSLASFMQSAIKAAELGLDFGGQTGQAYLVPLNNKWTGQTEANFWPGYQGFIELAYRSGKIDYIHAQLVHEKDNFKYGLGTEPFVKHTPYVMGEAGKVLCGYAVAFIKEAKFPLVEIMANSALEAIRQRSPAHESGPWKTDENEMKRKTLVRRIWKYLPKTPEMIEAEQADNEQFEMSGDFADDAIKETELGVNGLKKHIQNNEVNKLPSPAPAKRGRPKKTETPPPVIQKEYICPKCNKQWDKEQCTLSNGLLLCDQCQTAPVVKNPYYNAPAEPNYDVPKTQLMCGDCKREMKPTEIETLKDGSYRCRVCGKMDIIDVSIDA